MYQHQQQHASADHFVGRCYIFFAVIAQRALCALIGCSLHMKGTEQLGVNKETKTKPRDKNSAWTWLGWSTSKNCKPAPTSQIWKEKLSACSPKLKNATQHNDYSNLGPSAWRFKVDQIASLCFSQMGNGLKQHTRSNSNVSEMSAIQKSSWVEIHRTMVEDVVFVGPETSRL